jgi:hypothetical protein
MGRSIRYFLIYVFNKKTPNITWAGKISSAMTESDLILRGGLLISASVLIGIFAGFLTEGAVNSEEESVESLVNDLERIIRSISVSEPGSSTTISFGLGDDPNFISFPDRIGSNGIDLEILPGMVIITMDGNKYPVIEDPRILPMHVPAGGRSIPYEDLRDLSRETGGFILEMPGSVELDLLSSREGSVVLIHPPLESTGPIGELVDLEEIVFQPSSSFGEVIDLRGDEIGINNMGIIFWTGGDLGLRDGNCPLSYKLPPGTSLPYNLSFHSGDIRVIRQSVMISENLYQDKWIVET